MWNLMDVKCPSEDFCKYDEKDADIISELSELASLLTSSAETLTQEDPVWEEIKVFKNIQEKYKKMLHCDKCLLLIQRVGGCLRKMVILNLSKTFLDLGENIIKGLQKKGHTTLFPSRQQLEFILLRCQSAAKLVLEALHYSREAFYYLVQKLTVGHLVLHLVMAVSVTARVNVLFKGILVNLFSMYRKLYPWLNKLKKGVHEWAQDLNLPEDLEMWLKPDESQLLRPKHLPKEQMDFLTSYFLKKKEKIPSAADSDSVVEVDSDEESVIECTENKAMTENASALHTDDQSMDATEDLGEVISREAKPKNEGRSLTNKQKMLLKKISSAKTLKRIRIIWNHLDVNNPDLLPKVMTPAEIRAVEKMFLRLKGKMDHLKSSPILEASKQKKRAIIIKLAAKKLAKHLGLTEDAVPIKSEEDTAILKPVKTLKELRKLYKTLYNRLQSIQNYDRCHELKKAFLSRRNDIRLLKDSNEKDVADNLIFCTSKVLLAIYKL